VNNLTRNNPKIDVQEVRVVHRFSNLAVSKLNETGDPSLLLSLINSWSLVGSDDRKIVGRKILHLVNSGTVQNPIVLREVLKHVGTAMCTQPTDDAWQAVSHYLQADHLLSVNLEALRAGVRLKKSGAYPTTGGFSLLEREVVRLRQSPCPEVQDLAKTFCEGLV
jgi:hypothetical protein